MCEYENTRWALDWYIDVHLTAMHQRMLMFMCTYKSVPHTCVYTRESLPYLCVCIRTCMHSPTYSITTLPFRILSQPLNSPKPALSSTCITKTGNRTVSTELSPELEAIRFLQEYIPQLQPLPHSCVYVCGYVCMYIGQYVNMYI
jgi:hypothetical protein